MATMKQKLAARRNLEEARETQRKRRRGKRTARETSVLRIRERNGRDRSDPMDP